MESRRVLRCIVMCHDANRAEAVAIGLHARSRSMGLVISAATSAQRALEWIANDPPGTVTALVLIETSSGSTEFADCFVAARRRHPEVSLFTTGEAHHIPTPVILLPISREEAYDVISDRVLAWLTQPKPSAGIRDHVATNS